MSNPGVAGHTAAYYGLPEQVIFCRRCVMSNQRPSSFPEFKHTKARICPTLHIDEQGICDACRYTDVKQGIDWTGRERELHTLLDKHRRTDGHYDCVVPGSGGKDSGYTAHVLKYKYGMHPLTVTWPPILYTEYGHKNWRNWLEVGGFDNVTWKPNGRVMKVLTRLAIENLLHPFQTFILGQKNLAPKLASKFGIDLIFYGENEAEYGNPIADNFSSLRSKSFYTMQNLNELHLGGVPVPELREQHGIELSDIMTFLPAPESEISPNLQVHYLGYYLKWTPQESYYYAVQNTGFQARPFRTEGSYTKHASIDDKIDDLQFYTTWIKFGLGRASYDASQEVRNKHLTREEAVALVKRFDGEFPERYFQDVMDYLDMKPEHFHELCERAYSPHLFTKESGTWKLRAPVWEAAP